METKASEPRESPFLKALFVAFCTLPFILLPVLSLDAGISGDEPVHHAHAEKVYNYFATKGADRSALNTPETYLKYYGQFADDLSYRIMRWTKSENPYPIRHLLNSLMGALTILFSALIARRLAGKLSGILVVVLLILSPQFLGHSFNNVKDIPFAMGYTMTLYFLIVFIMRMPRVKWVPIAGMVIGTAFALSVRAGGLLLFPIILTFAGIQGLRTQPQSDYGRTLFWTKLLSSFAIIVFLGWTLGILDWPYARLGPVSHTLKALTMMTRYNVSLRQLFEGQLIWSQDIPWYYAPKYLLITTPEIIILGLLIFPFFFRLSPFASRMIPLGILAFSALFPLLWIIIKHSNLYGGIRHLLFIYPILVIFASIGWSELLRRMKGKWFRPATLILFGVGCSLPLVHIIRNHPMEYVYFNSASGGLKNAWGKYETDYYYHSLGPAVRWFESEILPKEEGRKITLASSFPLDPFFIGSRNKPDLVYVPFYQQGEKDWDYGIFPVAYLRPSQIRGQCWPPKGTLHEITVNGYPVCAIVKRIDKSDFQGFTLYKNEQYLEAVPLLRSAINSDPCNETAYMYLGWSYRKLGETGQSQSTARDWLKIFPESETAHELLIWNNLDQNHIQEAEELNRQLLELNPKYDPFKGILKNVKSGTK
jgi:hypothetical protein